MIMNLSAVATLSSAKRGTKLMLAAAIAVSAALAFSTRSTRQTSIHGLLHGGAAEDSRHNTTSFGSGWRGLSDEDGINYSAISMGVTGIAAYTFFRRKMVNATTGSFTAEKAFNFVKGLEDYSPFDFARTFAASELLSSYVPREVKFHRAQLVNDAGGLTELGQHFDRLLEGSDIHVIDQLEGMSFRRTDTSAYMEMEGTGGKVRARLAQRGRITGSSSRYNRPIRPYSPSNWNTTDSFWKRNWANFQELRSSQRPHASSAAKAVEGFNHGYEPYLMKIEGRGAVKNLSEKFGRVGLEQAERVQRLLADIGLGLKGSSWNKAFHVPFVGEGGLINQLLTKRALPIAIAAGVVLPWLDYKTGHSLSGVLVDTYQKASLTRASLTDHFLRSVTDKYAEIVPGPQYGPLALPATLAFAGGIGQYLAVLNTRRTQGEAVAKELRDSGSHVFARKAIVESATDGIKTTAREADKTLLKIFNRKSPVAWGALLGTALILPFIPGMIGSRKTKEELQRTYSGEDPIEIRAGRWWDMGVTPFEGGRVKESRPHWSVLWKTQAEKKALYGSEEEYWSHNPILHPLRWLRDPYWLEKKHYEDRPYAVTSPAFSGVPLIGHLLAATIGKVIKPPKAMHPEWDRSDYHLGSTRLEPRGPRIDSKFEAMVRENLAGHGYKVTTQEEVGKYRIDFAFQDDKGQKIGLEADGASYHGLWKAGKDKARQRFLEEQGWTILRLPSTEFFENPAAAMLPIYNALTSLDIKSVNPQALDLHSGLYGLAAPEATPEYSMGDAISRTIKAATEFVGLPGFIGRSVWNKIFPGYEDMGKNVQLQGSRQMENFSRRYYEMELGAVAGVSPDYELFGYSEPFRRFVQNEGKMLQANDIPNTMPSWLPGTDYFINFKVGDPYLKATTGFARLPGPGYEALHPDVEGLDPEYYPDIEKLRILGDIAPYSREFAMFKGKVRKQAEDNTELEIEYQKIVSRADEMRRSVIHTDERRFTADVEEVTGTVKDYTAAGIELKEYPGRVFRMSGISTTAADMSSVILGQNNDMTKAQVAGEVDTRREAMQSFLSDVFSPGTKVTATFQKGALELDPDIRSVLEVNGLNINKTLVGEGYGTYDKPSAGPEWQAMFGPAERAFGRYAEGVSHASESSKWNPLHWIPSPYHTKLWQQRSALAQYTDQETVGTRMREWDKPIKDFVSPYYHGLLHRVTGNIYMPDITREKRDLNTMVDMLDYLRGMNLASVGNSTSGTYTNQASRTAVGADLTGSSTFLGSTLPDRDARYFREFLNTTDVEERQKILNTVPEEMARSLEAQWATQEAQIERAEGKKETVEFSGGRLVTKAGIERFKKATTKLNYGDYQRSTEIADFFSRTGLDIPTPESHVWDENIDYEDVKLKIIQMEGRDHHDFNIFDDRASVLWRKPYIDGAVQELTSGKDHSEEEIRQQVEQLILAAKNNNANPIVSGHPSYEKSGTATVNVTVDERKQLLGDLRRNPENYN